MYSNITSSLRFLPMDLSASFDGENSWENRSKKKKKLSPAYDINTLSLFVSWRGLPFLIITFSTHGYLPAGLAKFLKIVKIKGENRVRVLAVKLLKTTTTKLYVHDFN